jgi:hypothetical protein
MTGQHHKTDFDEWIVTTFKTSGPFTMLFILVEIGDTTVVPLRTAYLHVMGDEIRWSEMLDLFNTSGVDWSGAVFYRAGREGLVRDDEANARMKALARKLFEDRSLIRDGEFFNRDGLRLALTEIRH